METIYVIFEAFCEFVKEIFNILLECSSEIVDIIKILVELVLLLIQIYIGFIVLQFIGALFISGPIGIFLGMCLLTAVGEIKKPRK